MKKLTTLLITLLVLVLALSIGAFAGNTVTHTGTGTESFTVTVPASLEPGQNGSVSVAGTWASWRTVTVSAPANVKLTNSKDASESETVAITFAGITKEGSDSAASNASESISVAAPTGALFGDWSGSFQYTVSIAGDPVTVSFAANGDTGTMSPVQLKSGSSITVPACGFTRQNYEFLGWSTSSDGAVAYAVDATITVNSNITLYAQWELKGFTVTLQSGEGTGDAYADTNLALPGEGYATPLTCSFTAPTGKIFNGWMYGSTFYAPGATIPGTEYNGNFAITAQWIDASQPLCFTATGESTIGMTKTGSPNVSLLYSTDGKTWNTFTPGTTNVTLTNTGDKVYFLAGKNNDTFSTGGSNYLKFTMSGSIAAGGNIMSLLDPKCTRTTIPSSYCFYDLFVNCTSLTTAPALPATTLANNCYHYMFYRCTSLTSAPELPATTLASACYSNMFNGCSKLATAPTLPATTLASSCYYYMFNGCTSLTTAPALPATTLATSCYNCMFQGCTGLTSAPALPATTLAASCYQSMFQDCTGLTSAPALPATTLKDDCYQSMFKGCTGLTSAPALPATTLAANCYYYMFRDCTSLTTAPALPATTLATYCYYDMFNGCSKLERAPELPATTLASYCYSHMFSGCTSLTSAPELPATTLKSHCYEYMFQNCRKLNYIKVGFTSWSTDTNWWVYYVASTGTFVCPSEMTDTSTGVSKIPSGWTVVKTYTVSFDAGEGSGEMADGTAYSNATYTIPECTFTAPSADKVFDCWSDGTNTYDPDDSITVTGDLTLTAQWKLNKLTITYKAGEGTGSDYTQEVEPGATARLMSNRFTNAINKQFTGWLGSDGKTYANHASITVKKDLTLTAQWKEVNYALLVDGATFNNCMNKLYSSDYSSDGDYFIEQVIRKPLSQKPSACNIKISLADGADVYLWGNKGGYNSRSTIAYYYTDAEVIYLNPDSSGMFKWDCELKSIDTTGWDTSRVTDMSSMFYWCPDLDLSFLTSFDTSNVTTMENMFYLENGKGRTVLDLSSFDTSKVTNMNSMFESGMNSSYLTTIYVSDLFVTDQVLSASYMFNRATNLVGGNETHCDGAGHNDNTDLQYARIDGKDGLPGFFTDIANKPALKSAAPKKMMAKRPMQTAELKSGKDVNAVLRLPNFKHGAFESFLRACEEPTGELGTDYFILSSETSDNIVYAWCDGDAAYWYTDADVIYCNENSAYLFYQLTALTDLDIEGWNTSNAVSMDRMFSECAALTTLDLTALDVSNATSMRAMFTDDTSLTALDLTGWNTENVENMSSMFAGCTALETITVGEEDFDTSALLALVDEEAEGEDCVNEAFAEATKDMFLGCDALTGGAGSTLKSVMEAGVGEDEALGLSFARIDGMDGQPGYFTQTEEELRLKELLEEEARRAEEEAAAEAEAEAEELPEEAETPEEEDAEPPREQELAAEPPAESTPAPGSHSGSGDDEDSGTTGSGDGDGGDGGNPPDPELSEEQQLEARIDALIEELQAEINR